MPDLSMFVRIAGLGDLLWAMNRTEIRFSRAAALPLATPSTLLRDRRRSGQGLSVKLAPWKAGIRYRTYTASERSFAGIEVKREGLALLPPGPPSEE